MAPAMPCKRDKQQSSIVKTNVEQNHGHEKEFKTMYGCIVESHESTRQRAESLQSKIHEDRIAGKGFTSVIHYNLVRKFIPMPQAMKIPDAEAAADEDWKKFATIPAWNLGKSQEQKGEVVLEARRDKMRVHFASLMDTCHFKMRSWNHSYRSTKAESCSGDIVKDDSGAYAVITEQGSSASQMTAAKIMDVVARLPGCDGQTADAVSGKTQVKLEDAPKLLKIPKSETVQMFGYVFHDTSGLNRGPVWKIQSFLLKGILYGHPLAGLLWERQFEKVLLKHGREKNSILGMSLRSSETRIFLVGKRG